MKGTVIGERSSAPCVFPPTGGCRAGSQGPLPGALLGLPPGPTFNPAGESPTRRDTVSSQPIPVYPLLVNHRPGMMRLDQLIQQSLSNPCNPVQGTNYLPPGYLYRSTSGCAAGHHILLIYYLKQGFTFGLISCYFLCHVKAKHSWGGGCCSWIIIQCKCCQWLS